MDAPSPTNQAPPPFSSSPPQDDRLHPQSLVPGGGHGHHEGNVSAGPPSDSNPPPSPINHNLWAGFDSSPGIHAADQPHAHPAGAGPSKPASRHPLIDSDNLPELVPQPPSYFHHDDKTEQEVDMQANQNQARQPTSTNTRNLSYEQFSERHIWRRCRTPCVPAIICIFVAAGVIISILFGTGKIYHNNSDRSRDSSPELPPGNHSHSLDGEANVEIRSSSQLAAATVGTAVSSFTLVLFQDADGELAAIEWQGSKGDIYRLKNRFGDAKPPRPMEHSPFHAVTHGESGDLHVFYFDDALRLTHIVRRHRNKEPLSWERGSLTAGSDPALVPAGNLRLSVASFAGGWLGLDDDCIVLAYHTGVTNDSMALVSTTRPDDAASWLGQSFSLGVQSLGLDFHPGSPGLVLLPIARGNATGVRMIWDLDNSSHKSTFGILDCTLTKRRALEDCTTIRNDWQDTNAEEEVLQMAKPLRLSHLSIRTKEGNASPADLYILRVLEARGAMTELLWDTNTWSGHQALTNETVTLDDKHPAAGLNLTSIASTSGLLYAVSGGKLLEFSREMPWWELSAADRDASSHGWRLIGEVDTKLSED